MVAPSLATPMVLATFSQTSVFSKPEIPYHTINRAELLPSDAASLAADDSEPWARKSILCLDGGEKQIISTLLILRELVMKIEEIEGSREPRAESSADSSLAELRQKSRLREGGIGSSSKFLLCHYFDYIAGSGIGGLIAIMLGRLRMSVNDVLERYKGVEEIFDQTQRRKITNIFKHDSRQQRLKSTIRSWRPAQSSPEEEERLFQSDSTRCRTIVCSLSGPENGILTPHLFRTYELQQDNCFDTWDIARATTAAPVFFKKYMVGGHRFVDGGVGLNNPSIQVLREVDKVHHQPQTHDPIDLFVSLGCRISPSVTVRRPRKSKSQKHSTSHVRSPSEAVHEVMQSESGHRMFSYYRIEAEVDVSDDPPSELEGSNYWNTKCFEDFAREYLMKPEVQERLKRCAELLVSKRRDRSETMRWESFALGTKYRCKYKVDGKPCPKKSSNGKPFVFRTRNDLLDHLRWYHRMTPPSLESHDAIKTLIDQGRTNSDSSDQSADVSA